MSVQRRDGKYLVRWREGGRQYSRTFLKRGDATAFDTDIKRRQQLGSIAAAVIQSHMTLAEFVDTEWWPRYAVPNLKPSTKRRYLEVWGTHLLPRLGDYQLRAITPMLVEDLCAQLDRQGVGVQTQRKTLMLLQGILRRAVVREIIPMNPVQVVDKPRQPPTRRPQPLTPEMVEKIRTWMLTKSWEHESRGTGRSADELWEWRTRNATLMSLLAYAGLRPDEATSTRWRDLSDRSLYVHASKTETHRRVRLLQPLAQDLAEWRMLTGRPAENSLIFPREHGASWKPHDWNNWRRRVYKPAAIAAGVTDDMRVYRLRGSFVSLLLWEGRSLTYVAEQAGHSVATLAKHYAGVMEDLEDAPQITADEAIRAARERSSERRMVG